MKPWRIKPAPQAEIDLGFKWDVCNVKLHEANIAVDDEGLAEYIARLLNCAADRGIDMTIPMPVCRECGCLSCDCACHE